MKETQELNGYSGSDVLVLGGAGFLGSHLCTKLVEMGARVVCIDNLITGRADNLAHISSEIDIRQANVTERIDLGIPLDFIFNFASPASPVDFERWPIQILKTGAYGTHNGLGLALAKGARYVHASTSEVYGDPLVNPQSEDYWGNVNPIGVRGVYDEGKRFGEALVMAYRRAHGLETRIARIFNTYGPRMRPDDGRAIPAFFSAALRNLPLPVHGDGSQTRSLCYVEDLIEGILRLGLSGCAEPVNLGNPEEISILQLAEEVQAVVGNHPGVVFQPRPEDDPTVRRPDISRALSELGWSPAIPLREGLTRTAPWFREALGI